MKSHKEKPKMKKTKPKKLSAKQQTTKKSNKTRKPSVKQTDRDASGRFVKGNKTGNRFESGIGGNPAGPPKAKVQLWRYFCNFMAMTDTQIKKLDCKKLTQAQQSALKLVENMKYGKDSGSERLARHVFDREEGKPVEHLVIEPSDILTDEECNEIRDAILRNHAN